MTVPAAAPDETVVRQAHEWLRGHPGECVALITVAETLRSAPSPPGTLMAMRADGAMAGSVSGGCVEGALARQLAASDFRGAPRRLEFGVNEADAARAGLSCGGRITLLVEFLNDAADLAELVAALDERRACRRSVDLATGTTRVVQATPGDRFELGAATMTQVIGPLWQLLILGANDVARVLSMHALVLGYRVVVVDPRTLPRPAWIVPPLEFSDSLPEDVVTARVTDPRSAVVALLHAGHLEDPALAAALRGPAFYVGAMGSSATNDARRARLARLGVPDTALSRLRAPIGLRLGGRSSAEIALAIAAELTAARHGRLESAPTA